MSDRYCLTCGCHEEEHSFGAIGDDACSCGLCERFVSDEEGA